MNLRYSIFGLCCILASCGKQTPPSQTAASADSTPLARAGDEILTQQEFEAAATRRGATTAASKQALLEEMTTDLRLLNHAKQLGLDRDPEIIRQYRSLLIAKARERIGGPTEETAPISEAAVQSYYNEHRQEFAVPARIHVAMLQVSVPPGCGAEFKSKQRQKIEAGIATIQSDAAGESPTNFGTFALTYSEDQSTRYAGGDLGWLIDEPSRSPLPLLAHQAAFSLLQPGKMSGVVETGEGFFVFRLIERQDSTVPPFTPAIAARIRTKLAEIRRVEKAQRSAAEIVALPGGPVR